MEREAAGSESNRRPDAMGKTEHPRAGALEYVFSRRVAGRSLLVAAIVGLILSLVNQGDVLLHTPPTAGIALKLFFNFLIPFAVASVSAALNRPQK